MGEKIARISITLPQELLKELDKSLRAQRYASRSEAIRDAVRDFLAAYKWRTELRGEQLGVIVLLYDHHTRGLTDVITEIQHEKSEVIRASQHMHIDQENCMETLMVKGPSEEIKRLVDRLGALRGVKQAKLIVVSS